MDATESNPGDEPRRGETTGGDVEPDPRLLELALRIADEQAVDWEAERLSAPDLSESFEQLRELEAVAAARRRAEEEEIAIERPPLFQWGPLRVLERVGQGGYGDIYLAWDPALHRQVALKLRREDRARRPDRWLDEARRLARIRHPHVLTVYGAETHDGRSGIWCDLIRGRTLEEWIQDNGPMSATEATHAGIDLCAALAAVHSAGLVHGDVKAKNVMRRGASLRAPRAPADPAARTPDLSGNLVLMDFGASQEIAPGGSLPSDSAGTPLYAAPELLRGGRPSVSSDIYAVGVLLFRLVTGQFAVEATSMEDLRRKIEEGAVTPLRTLRPDLPPAFVEVVERATAADPARRFRDAAELERALRGVLALPARAPARRARARHALAPALAGAAAVALAWAGVTWLPELLRPRFRVAPARPYAAFTLRESLAGSSVGDNLGQSVAGLGDLDGDGVPDYAVGAPGADQSRGEVTVYSGVAGRAPLLRLQGEHQGDQFGFTVASLGDINGDGHPDFAVAALDGDGREIDSGTVSVYHGGPALRAEPAAVLQGRLRLSAFGFSVAGAGDVNRDGYADFLISAPAESPGGKSQGAVYLYFGGAELDTVPRLILTPGSEGSQFGISVSGLGDFNGDGIDDFAVGANWDDAGGPHAGRAFVYYGGPGLHNRPDLILNSPGPGAWFGKVCGPGDLNGDGFADLAAGAWFGRGYAPASGTVSIYYGGQRPAATPALVLKGEVGYGEFGSSLAALGDVNGDGLPDLAVGAPRADLPSSDCGCVYLYFGGKPMRPTAGARFVGSGVYDAAGMGLAGLGDLDGDGLRDFIIGAPAGFGHTNSGGRALIYASSRFSFTRPAPAEAAIASDPLLVTWNGAEVADLQYSSDGGATWTTVARRVGGAPENRLRWTAPSVPTERARLRLVPATPGVAGSAESAPFLIRPRRSA